jgi:predicted transcriptional regulator
MTTQQQLIEVRKLILEFLTKEMSTKELEDLLQDSQISAVKIGNNLRYLEKAGYVTRKEEGARRTWQKTGKVYNELGCIGFSLQLPEDLFKALTVASEKIGMSKTDLVIDALKDYLGS